MVKKHHAAIERISEHGDRELRGVLYCERRYYSNKAYTSRPQAV